jgi:hypothetical protein
MNLPRRIIPVGFQVKDLRCQMVLACIFIDLNVRTGLGFAEVFRDISGLAPATLLNIIKRGPAKHIKKRKFAYTQALKKEVAYINLILNYQARFIALLGTGVMTVGVAIGSFVADIGFAYVFPNLT